MKSSSTRTGLLYRDRKEESTDRHEDRVNWRQRPQWCSYKPSTTSDVAGSPQKLGRGKQGSFPGSSSRRTALPTACSTEKEQSSFKPASLWWFVTTALGNWYILKCMFAVVNLSVPSVDFLVAIKIRFLTLFLEILLQHFLPCMKVSGNFVLPFPRWLFSMR